jgi:hypothetical protein
VQAKDRRKHYSAPQLRRLNFEQASLFLVGHTWNGDNHARDLPEVIFPQRKVNALDVARHPSEEND